MLEVWMTSMGTYAMADLEIRRPESCLKWGPDFTVRLSFLTLFAKCVVGNPGEREFTDRL